MKKVKNIAIATLIFSSLVAVSANTSAAQAGDTIIIDTKKRTATKNGENILASRVAGSQRPTIKGEERFLVSSLYGGLQSAFEVKIYFANVML